MNESNTNKLTLIKRSTPICPQCTVMQNMLEDAKISYDTIDIAQNPEAIEKYDISSVPVLLINDEDAGQIKLNGIQPVELIKEMME